MVIKFHCKTDIGKKRTVNEDRIWPETSVHPQANNPYGLLFVIADGMGGHGQGDLASQLAVEAIITTYYSNAESLDAVPQRLERAILTAHARISQEAKKKPAAKRMGTTAVAAVIKYDPAEQTGRLWVAWVGDSRAYYWSEEAGLHLLTEDHSKLWPQFKAGEIGWTTMQFHPDRSVLTNSLTAQREVVKVSQVEHKLRPGDQILLCSDGLSSEVSNKEIEQTLNNSYLEVAAQALIEQAKAPKKWHTKDGELKQSEGGNDNISVIVINLPGGKFNQVTKPVPKSTPRRLAGWVWGLLGMAILLLVGVIYYLNSGSNLVASSSVTPTVTQPTILPKQSEPVIISIPMDTQTTTPTSTSEPEEVTAAPQTATRRAEIPAPRLATLTPTPTATFTRLPEPTPTPTVTPTAAALPIIPDENLGQVELIYPTNKDKLPEGAKEVIFKWRVNDQCNLSKEYGFDIRVAVAGETMQGVMDVVLNQDKIVCNSGERTYTVGDFMSVPGIDRQAGWFEWEVRVVNLVNYDKDSWILSTRDTFELGTGHPVPTKVQE